MSIDSIPIEEFITTCHDSNLEANPRSSSRNPSTAIRPAHDLDQDKNPPMMLDRTGKREREDSVVLRDMPTHQSTEPAAKTEISASTSLHSPYHTPNVLEQASSESASGTLSTPKDQENVSRLSNRKLHPRVFVWNAIGADIRRVHLWFEVFGAKQVIAMKHDGCFVVICSTDAGADLAVQRLNDLPYFGRRLKVSRGWICSFCAGQDPSKPM
ncbi:hypothetical protein MMC25_007940 [Agyrium rufum]|nr:hypothetical protein [Agyrium rufum]